MQSSSRARLVHGAGDAIIINKMKYKVCLLLAVVALTSASKDADEWESWKKVWL